MRMNKRLNALFIAIAGMLCTAFSAQAAVYASCDRWGTYTQGDWTIYNNVWGTRKPNTQCLSVNSIKSWSVNSNQSTAA